MIGMHAGLGAARDNRVDQAALGRQSCLQGFLFDFGGLQRGLCIDNRLAVVLSGGGFALMNTQLMTDVFNTACDGLDPFGHTGLRLRDSCAGGIQNTDRFVGQLAPGDEAVGKSHRFAHGDIEDVHFMVCFQALDDTAQHVSGNGFRGLVYLDYLKAACQCRIALDIFFVLGPGRGGDGAQLAACQGWLEQVSCITGAFTATGADQLMGFIDEQHNRRDRRFDFGDDHLQTVFKFTFDAGAGLQQP